jgi:hypothetical protein
MFYSNPDSLGDDTYEGYYIKHVATRTSALDLADYEETSDSLCSLLLYEGYKIGWTICYDSTLPLFSRAFGLMSGIDWIMISTEV